MQFSIVIPSYNEAESLAQLLQEIHTAMCEISSTYEIIIIDDGSTDQTSKIMAAQTIQDPHLKYIRLTRNYGKAAALHAGVAHSTGRNIITLDADLQDDPACIRNVINKLSEGFDLVVGWKEKRQDAKSKIIASKLFNFFTNKISRTHIHDHNSGLKIMTREVAGSLPLYGDLHRYIPAIASINGFNIADIAVKHRPRLYGKSKYGLRRMFHGFFDLITVVLITRYASKPMHLFGYTGLVIFLLGFGIGLYVTYACVFLDMKFTDRPYIQLSMTAMLCMILGVQIGITGIIGELINYNKRDPSRYYTIRSTIHDQHKTPHSHIA